MPRKKYTVTVLSPRSIVTASDGDLLADVLRGAGIPMSLYCGGRGICGKCLVEIVRGDVVTPSERESEFLQGKGLGIGSRLACLTRVRGNLSVKVPRGSLLKDVAVLDAGLDAQVRPEPAVRKLSFDVPAPGLSDPVSAVEAIERRLGKRLRYSASAAARAATGSGREGGRITVTLLDGDELLDVEPGDTSSLCFGAAVDVGTSTIAVELIDLISGRRLGRAAAVNAQAPYGMDVVTRITYAGEAAGNLERLADILHRQIDGMIADLARERGVALGHVYEIVAAGNSAMNHILVGVPVTTLASAPYHAAFAKAPWVRAADLGLSVNPGCRVYVAPNLKSFVGGDIAAGVSALDLWARPGNILFVDLGTNGEIVLKKGTRTTTTSTAAGPAFEGMSIDCGMLAVPGAVCAARWEGGLAVRTVGGTPALGVCSTGLVDILAVGLRHGLLSAAGRIRAASRTIPVAGGISLTQQDVRKLQLAVAAIRTGIVLMLVEAGIAVSALDGVFVAGAFGASLNVRNAMSVGLLPSIDVSRVAFVGNSSLAGARKLLLSRPERGRTEAFARRARHVSLASCPGFQTEFVKAMKFEPYK
jgi:uncharacterized 2Fe-2S/4Fe-4S cluster protein (DUF4445 family)